LLPGLDFCSARRDDSAMKLDQLISNLIGRLMGRMLRRMTAFAMLALLILITLYHLTIAGTLALEALYGPLYARLIVAGIYAVLAIVVLAYLLATRVKTTTAAPRRNRQPQDIRVAELLESLLVGYTTGRRKSRHS
jgi:hypothetical protein